MSRNLRIDSAETRYVSAGSATLELQGSLHLDGGTFVRLDKSGRTVSAHFSAADARRIGAWLVERYGLAPYAPAIGETVRILPDAERYDGEEVDFPDVRRAKVVFGLDSDGEYRVEALDGDDVGEDFYVAAAFIRHADAILAAPAKPAAAKAEAAPTAAIVVGQEYRLLPDSKYAQGSRTYFKSSVTRVRLTSRVKSDGNVSARALDGVAPGEEWHVDPKYLAPLATAATSEPAPLKVGDVVDLKPNAKTSYGGGVYFSADVTRVKVKRTAGRLDYFVTAVNGSGAHGSRTEGQNVGRAYLGDPTPVAEFAPEVGGTYALKADACTIVGPFRFVAAGVTRVEVVGGVDRDGEVYVKALDGTPGFPHAHVLPSGLAPLPATPTATPAEWVIGDMGVLAENYATLRAGDRVQVTNARPRWSGLPGQMLTVRRSSDGAVEICLSKRVARPDTTERPWAVGDEAIVLRDRPRGAEFFAGDRVRIVRIDGPSIGAECVSGRGSLRASYRHLTWYVNASDIRRP